ncbi:hypothetical protein [Streptomyces sp. NPDC001843]|uniref:hypothetical protein n=1 Tax=Streptomyces sp. NPDC001843 TaxID=3364617 RepID=UPI0036A8BE98
MAQEAGQRQFGDGRAQGPDTRLDAGGTGTVQDEQQPREQRIAAPPVLFWKLPREGSILSAAA